jgi:hypothetical protein
MSDIFKGNEEANAANAAKKGAVKAPQAHESAEFFSADFVTLDNFAQMLMSAFGHLSKLKHHSPQLHAAVAGLLEAVAAAAPPSMTGDGSSGGKGGKGSKGDADFDELRSSSLADRAMLPTQFVLAQLGLALAHSYDDLATVLYRLADYDGDGEVRTAELTRWMLSQQTSTTQSLKHAQKLLVTLDIDGDGKITETEFVAGIAKKPALLETFGMLLGANSKQLSRGGSRDFRSGNEGSASGEGGSGSSGESRAQAQAHTPSIHSGNAWAGDEGPVLAENVDTFGGMRLFGIGEAEEQARRKLSLVEKIERRRREYASAAHGLATQIAREKRGLVDISHHTREVLSKATRTAEIQVQKQKLVVATMSNLGTAATAASASASASRPRSRSRSRSASRSRPASAAAGRRKEAATEGKGGENTGSDGRPSSAERSTWRFH